MSILYRCDFVLNSIKHDNILVKSCIQMFKGLPRLVYNAMADKTYSFRPSDEVDDHLQKLYNAMVEQSDDHPEIIGYRGEVPMGKVIEAIITTYLCADVKHEEQLLHHLRKLSVHNSDIEYNYE